LSVRLSPCAPEGFIVFSHAGNDWPACRDHVRRLLGLPHRTGSRLPQETRRPAVEPQSRDDERRGRDVAMAAAYVEEMRPLSRTPGERYLREVRRIDTGAIADVLERTDAIGWHSAVYFHEPDHLLHRQRLGCIVGVITDPVSARPTGAISRTLSDNPVFLNQRERIIEAYRAVGIPEG
jgi:hypothetical protein